jgi:hypothetical protein
MTNVIFFSLEKLHLRRITLPLNYEAIARANTPCAHRLSYLLFPHAIAGEIRVCARMDSDLSQRQERVRIDAAKAPHAPLPIGVLRISRRHNCNGEHHL